MLESLPVLALLIVGGAMAMVASLHRFLFGGLITSAVALAILLVPYTGLAVAGALFIANATSVAMMGLGSAYRAGHLDNPAEFWQKARASVVKPTTYRNGWQNGSSSYLQWLSVILAAVIALGLSDRSILGTIEAGSGTPGFVAYWLLTLGFMIIMVQRGALKVGGGLVLAINGAQVMYLTSASSLEVVLIIAMVGVMLAVSLGISYLTAVGATVESRVTSDPENNRKTSATSDRQRESEPAQEGGTC